MERRKPAYIVYLKPEELTALDAAIRSGDFDTVTRYNGIVEQRKAARNKLAVDAQRAKQVTRQKKRRSATTNVAVAAGIGVCLAGVFVAVQSQKSGPADAPSVVLLQTSGPCNTSVDNVTDKIKTIIGDMKPGQTGWVTYWTVVHDGSGDWIDTNAKAGEAGGGTAEVCIQRTPSGFEAWQGEHAITGDRNSTGPKMNWVPAKIHPYGQK